MSNCLACGKELVINKHFPNKKYCSSKCRQRGHRSNSVTNNSVTEPVLPIYKEEPLANNSVTEPINNFDPASIKSIEDLSNDTILLTQMVKDLGIMDQVKLEFAKLGGKGVTNFKQAIFQALKSQ